MLSTASAAAWTSGAAATAGSSTARVGNIAVSPLFIASVNTSSVAAFTCAGGIALFADSTAINPSSRLAHVRTRHHSPETNGVVERFNQSLKYEHLYRNEISNGQHLVEEIATYSELYNQIRPHESLDFTAPIHTYLATPS
jgi:Integrase core domain